MRRLTSYFTHAEIIIWAVSIATIVTSFIIFDRENYLTLTASLIGATSLIFNAKGNPIGQLLMVIFSALYGIISFTFAYYGEMITYMGMTAPMALFSLVAWLRNPYKGNKAEVEVNHIHRGEVAFSFVLTGIVTLLFYFILKAFDTQNLILSTLSVTTSFMAVYLTFRRSAFYAIAYAINDIVLIVLWLLATAENISYLSVVICFVIFFANDIYGFISWQKMHTKQKMGK